MKRNEPGGKTASAPASIWTLKIRLVFGIYAEGPWEATVEIDSSATLSDLHSLIQSAVQFSDDHLYTFYIARTWRSRDRIEFDEDDGSLLNTSLEEIFPLPPDRTPDILRGGAELSLYAVANCVDYDGWNPVQKKVLAAAGAAATQLSRQV